MINYTDIELHNMSNLDLNELLKQGKEHAFHKAILLEAQTRDSINMDVCTKWTNSQKICYSPEYTRLKIQLRFFTDDLTTGGEFDVIKEVGLEQFEIKYNSELYLKIMELLMLSPQ